MTKMRKLFLTAPQTRMFCFRHSAVAFGCTDDFLLSVLAASPMSTLPAGLGDCRTATGAFLSD